MRTVCSHQKKEPEVVQGSEADQEESRKLQAAIDHVAV